MMKTISTHILLSSFFLVFQAYSQTPQGAPPPLETPAYFLQILNGISPGPIDIEIDGKIVFPSIGTGQRISAFGVSKKETKLAVIEKVTGHRKEIPTNFTTPGNYTLILGGDFKAVQTTTSSSSNPSENFRIISELFNNGTRPSGSDVRVRIVNGMVGKPVSIKFPGNRVVTVSPLEAEEVSGLPSELTLQASSNETKNRNLYLSQESPPKNIAVFFFPSGDDLGFKAMTEITPEGLLSDQKKPQTAKDDKAVPTAKQ